MSKELEYWNSVLPERIADEACPVNITDHCISKIEPHLIDGDIFDLGCGPGRMIVPLSERTSNPQNRYFGIDFSERMISIAPKRHNISYRINDGKSIPSMHLFHSGYSMLMFQHVTADVFANYLKEVYKVLLFGGTFRFQFVFGTEDVFLARNTNFTNVINWIKEAGLTLVNHEMDELYPTWMWVTCRKP